jgi:hypothetical protein
MASKDLDFVRGVAFRDELNKIAGEMQGYTRIGRKPISIEKMLANENEVTGLPDDFVQQSMKKAAQALVKMSAPKVGRRELALLGGGAAAALVGRQANEDRRLGRMVRKQQGQ